MVAIVFFLPLRCLVPTQDKASEFYPSEQWTSLVAVVAVTGIGNLALMPCRLMIIKMKTANPCVRTKASSNRCITVMFFFASLVHPCRIEVRKQRALHQAQGPQSRRKTAPGMLKDEIYILFTQMLEGEASRFSHKTRAPDLAKTR
jgi:hypothetical protein